MKKVFLFRLFAITFFCLATLLIKSGTSACKSVCTGIVKIEVMDKTQTPFSSSTDAKDAYYKYGTFFIKI